VSIASWYEHSSYRDVAAAFSFLGACYEATGDYARALEVHTRRVTQCRLGNMNSEQVSAIADCARCLMVRLDHELWRQ
jgi:hypothetical protein